MTHDADTRRYAALLLRFAAQFVSGEREHYGTRGVLTEAGYDRETIEAMAHTFAAEALAMVEPQAARRAA